MRVTFQYSCDEWIELRRVAGTRQILGHCIYLAEASLVPLILLSCAAIALLVLAYVRFGVVEGGAWASAFAFGGLVGVAVVKIYLSHFRHLGKRVLIEDWESHGSQLRYSIEVNEVGIDRTPDEPAEGEPQVAWGDILSVVQTKRFYMLRRRDDTIFIPKSVFARDADRESFLNLLYVKTVQERTVIDA
jgi:hypothetical protein